MNVLIVEPNTVPYEKEINGLEEMQEVVGGLITAIYPYEDRSVENGYGGIFGTFFVCGLTEDDFGSLTPEQVRTYKEKFRFAEILVGVHDNTPITLKVPALPKEKPPKQQERHTPPGKDR